MNRLPFIPKAQSEESPLSILRRSAINNGYQQVLALLHSLVPHIDHSNGMLGYIARSPALYRRLASLMGIQNLDINLVTYDRIGSAREDKLLWQGLKIPYNDLHFKTEKLCIPCYLEKGYAISEWDHQAAVGCKNHSVYLEDNCPVCHTTWTFDQEPLSCGCDQLEIMSQLRPIPFEQASLLSGFIANKDQTGIDKLSIAYKLIKWWKNIGIPVSNDDAQAFLYQLVNDKHLELSTAGSGEKLHPYIFMKPLLQRNCDISQSMSSKLLSNFTRNIFSQGIEHVLVSRKDAQSLFGISRTRFDKFIDEGLVTLKGKSMFSLNEINRLLYSSTWLPLDSKNTPKMKLLAQQGKHISLAQLVKTEITGNPTLHKTPHQNDNKFVQDYITIPEAAERLSSNYESIRYLIKTSKLPATKGTPKSPVQWSIEIDAIDSFNEKYIFASSIARKSDLPVTTTSSRLTSAGIKPVSGPGIDGGKTYVFARADIENCNLKKVLKNPYHSPAGRKLKKHQHSTCQYITSSQLAEALKIKTHKVRAVVRDGWIAGTKNSQGHYRFNHKEAAQLAERINRQYIDIETASKALDQSLQSFRYTWILTGFAQEHILARRLSDLG